MTHPQPDAPRRDAEDTPTKAAREALHALWNSLAVEERSPGVFNRCRVALDALTAELASERLRADAFFQGREILKQEVAELQAALATALHAREQLEGQVENMHHELANHENRSTRLRAELTAWQHSYRPCEQHTPDKWESDGTCVICEATDLFVELDRLRAERDTAQRQTAWLIARVGRQWWTGRGNEWTDAVDGGLHDTGRCAIRFARKEDAARAIGWLVDAQHQDFCHAEEHVWG